MRPLGVVILLGLLVSGCASESSALGQARSSSSGPVGMTSASVSPPVEQLHGFVLILHESSPGHITLPLTAFSSSEAVCEPRFAAVQL